jgi:hypothetical protein
MEFSITCLTIASVLTNVSVLLLWWKVWGL